MAPPLCTTFNKSDFPYLFMHGPVLVPLVQVHLDRSSTEIINAELQFVLNKGHLYRAVKY